MSITRVAGQTDQLAFTTSGTSIGMTFPQNVVAGNAIVCMGSGFNLNVGTYPNDGTVADTFGNTYAKDDSHFQVDELRVTIFSSTLATGGADTVTFSSAGDGTHRRCIAGMEYTFAGGATRDKVAHSNAASGTAVSSGATATTTAADELCFGAMADAFNGVPYTAGSGWTKRKESGSSSGQSMFEDKIVAATGTYTADATASNSVAWVALIATYKEVGGGATVAPMQPTSSMFMRSNI
jgi:hypothetical protein